MNNLYFNDVKIEIEKDNSNLNSVYNQVILLGPESFSSFEEYASVIHYLVKNYVFFNDYLHSNNLLQVFKIHSINNKHSLGDQDWYQYYLIKVCSKRSIKYYLDYPSKFWEVVYNLAGNIKASSSYIERLDNLLVDILDFYKAEYVNYPDYLQKSLQCFVDYYFKNKPYSQTITAHMNELRQLVKSSNAEKVKDIYNNLETQNVDTLVKEENANIDSVDDDYYSDIKLVDDEDFRKKIMVVGDDKFIHNENTIFSLANEVFNIQKNQFEFYTDYSKIKNDGERIVKKTQWNNQYIGIIFGSTPHSTSGNDGASSLITLCTTEAGFPPCEICKPSNNGGRPKITKQSFKNALRKLIIKYKSA